MVLGLGDLAYPNGSIEDFVDCYGPSLGRFRSITRAAPGNHEYHTPHAGAYYAYFCGSSGAPFEGYYSFTIGRRHVVALNSNCGMSLHDDIARWMVGPSLACFATIARVHVGVQAEAGFEPTDVAAPPIGVYGMFGVEL